MLVDACSSCRLPVCLQIGMLPNLRHLHVHHPFPDASSHAALAQLPLDKLELLNCVGSGPDCLSSLTALRSLAVEAAAWGGHEEAAVASGLARALPRLTRLSYLALSLRSAEPLACLASLTNLRSLLWWREPQDYSAALPPGGWLAGLHTLGAPCSLVARSLPALGGAARLEQLCLCADYGFDHQELRPVIGWAARHPALRRLLLGDQPLPGRVWADVATTRRQRPSLRIEASTLDSLFG